MRLIALPLVIPEVTLDSIKQTTCLCIPGLLCALLYDVTGGDFYSGLLMLGLYACTVVCMHQGYFSPWYFLIPNYRTTTCHAVHVENMKSHKKAHGPIKYLNEG